jgi:hypothetical protein
VVDFAVSINGIHVLSGFMQSVEGEEVAGEQVTRYEINALNVFGAIEVGTVRVIRCPYFRYCKKVFQTGAGP